ncbi:hypothetical protein ACFFRR_001515 [Megaselia abdita]
MFKCIVFIALFAPAVWSYSAGAPKDICLSNDPNVDLFPQHGGVKSQESQIPYTLSGPNKVKGGETVSFTLKGNNNLKFKGFILQGRANGQPVGSFTPKTSSQTIDCKGSKDTVTHKKLENGASTATFDWKAPASKQSVIIFGTVAENGGKFWVKKIQHAIQVE